MGGLVKHWFGGGSNAAPATPPPPPPIPPAANPATIADTSIQAQGAAARARAAAGAGAGFEGTLLTGSTGTNAPANRTLKTLTGE